MFRFTICATAFLLTTAPAAFAQSSADQQFEVQWRQFHANPKAFMEKPPVKRDQSGRVIRTPRFPTKSIRSKEFIELKSAYRLGEDRRGREVGSKICNRKGVCLKDVRAGRAAAQQRVEDFLDVRELGATRGRIIKNLNEMENRKLLAAKLDETPWSDSYWPIFSGVLGWRYMDPAQNQGRKWVDYFNYINNDSKSLLAVYKRGNSDEINALSPSEKYDLIIGNLESQQGVAKNGFLTPQMWREGKGYWDRSGDVESWMGICHGWAVASYMVPRPSQAITVLAADGRTEITLYPSDMKGLASFAWAYSAPPMRFLGGRCDDKDARRDPETGRLLDEKCFDTNPANWHVAVVNQIGVAKRSMIIDATFDYEVWNQPVFGYQYKYFNPQTGQVANSLKAAIVPVAKFSNDKFKRFRSSNAAYVVGIKMDLTYVVETQPSHRPTDSAAYDQKQTVEYMYDLEISERGEIIGGEWYSNIHPDFLWNAEVGARARAAGDARVPVERIDSAWNTKTVLPRFWADLAVQNATRTGEPLATIIERLVIQSKREQPAATHRAAGRP